MDQSFSFNKFHKLALILYVLSINFETWDPLNTGIDYLNTKITITLYLFLSFLKPMTFFNLRNTGYFMYPLILIFVIQTIMSYLNINSSYNEYFDLPIFLNYLLVIALSNHIIKDSRNINIVIDSYITSGIILTIFFFLDIDTNHSWAGRSTIFGFNQNQLAVNLALLLIFILWPVISKPSITFKRESLLKLIFIPFILIFLTATGSRSGILTFVIALFGMLFLKPTISWKKKIKTIFSAFVILTLTLIYFSSSELVTERFTASINEGDMSGRDFRWIGVFEIILQHPIFGLGKTGYSLEVENILGFYSSPHNVLLETAAYTGIVGLILLLVFYYRILKIAVSIRKKTGNHFFIVLLSPILIMTLFGHTFGSKVSYIIFSMIFAMKFLVNENHIKT